MKKLIGVGIILAVAAVAAFFMMGSPLGNLVKLAIEGVGPDMLQAEVSVSSVKISATDGQGMLQKFRLGNPKGFKTAHAFKADSIEMVIDPASIAQDTIVVRKVVIDAPSISYEKGDIGTNFDAIQRNVDSYLGTSNSNHSDKGASKKVIIESFVIRNAKVSYNGTIALPLPDIELHNIGKKGGGASFAQVSKAIFGELNAKLAFSKSAVIDSVSGAAAGAGNALKGLLRK